MKALFKLSSIAGLLIVLIGLVLFFAIGNSVYSSKGSSLKFVNASGKILTTAIITVAGKSCGVKRLGVGGEIICYFENLHDSSYSVSVTLISGKVFTAESLGYVTGGMDFNDTITINEAGEFNLVSSVGT